MKNYGCACDCNTCNACTQADKFQCAHGKMCIEKSQVCDGVPQCQDRSDELQCVTLMRGCVHHCDNKTRCLPANFLCDGEEDCTDGTDEATCGTFWCIYSTELTLVFMLDLCICLFFWFWIIMLSLLYFIFIMYPGEDKKEEETITTSVPTVLVGPSKQSTSSHPIKCSFGFIPCSDNSECIQNHYFCDGEADCRDGSDEAKCSSSCEKGNLFVICLLLIWLYCHLVSNASFTSVLVHGQLTLWLFTIRAPLKITIAIVFS